jgi:hypothetical protein
METTQTQPPAKLSDELEQWLLGEGEKTLGGLVGQAKDKSFALLFVLLLGVPALPLPTGGATHVFEIIAALLALELIAGREEIWIPRRWRNLELAGQRQQKFIATLIKWIRRLERISRRRLAFVFDTRVGKTVFGLLVLGGTAGAFFAPPFTGLDTVPALGVVILSLAVLLEDILIAGVGIVLGAAGVLLEIVAGTAVVHAVGNLF